jgi:hypothetical protein
MLIGWGALVESLTYLSLTVAQAVRKKEAREGGSHREEMGIGKVQPEKESK